MMTGKLRVFSLDPVCAFKTLHITFSLVILIASLKTVVEAMGASNQALVALASVEAIAAIFFIFPGFIRSAGLVLMAIFLLVIIISVLTGMIINNVHLVLYFACTLFIVAHASSCSKRQLTDNP